MRGRGENGDEGGMRSWGRWWRWGEGGERTLGRGEMEMEKKKNMKKKKKKHSAITCGTEEDESCQLAFFFPFNLNPNDVVLLFILFF